LDSRSSPIPGDVDCEGPDQVEDVLVVGPVHPQPADIVQDHRLDAVVVQGVGDLPYQFRESRRFAPLGAEEAH
jgi:hypothetical protein